MHNGVSVSSCAQGHIKYLSIFRILRTEAFFCLCSISLRIVFGKNDTIFLIPWWNVWVLPLNRPNTWKPLKQLFMKKQWRIWDMYTCGFPLASFVNNSLSKLTMLSKTFHWKPVPLRVSHSTSNMSKISTLSAQDLIPNCCMAPFRLAGFYNSLHRDPGQWFNRGCSIEWAISGVWSFKCETDTTV